MKNFNRNCFLSLQTLVCIAIILSIVISMGHYAQLNQASTGAPGETTCVSCHINPSPVISGGAIVSGIPQYVVGGQTYPVTMKVYTNNVNAITAGFQMTLRNINGTSHGILTESSSHVGLAGFGGKDYVQHMPGILFNQGGVADTAYFPFEWTPDDVTVNKVVRYFYAALLGNGEYQPGSAPRNDKMYSDNDNTTVVPELGASIDILSEVLCFEGTQGSLRAIATGGLVPIEYLWSNGQTADVISGLEAGMYTVTVTDAIGQMAIRFAQLSQPDEIQIELTATAPKCFESEDGSILAVVTGGNGPYTYLWSTGSSQNPLENIGEALYTVTATDVYQCVETKTIAVHDPEQIEIIPEITEPTCNGFADGTIVLDPLGGTPPYTFHWVDGSSSNTLINIEAGSYRATVTDVNQCTRSIDVMVGQPDLLEVEVVAVEPQTNSGGGSIVIDVSGGTTPYSYRWTGPNGFSSSVQNPSNLEAGIYGTTVTDMHTCEVRLTIEVEFVSVIDEFSEHAKIVISPNPGTAELSILFPDALPPNWMIQILSASGQVLHQSVSNAAGWKHLNVSDLPYGVYVIRLNNFQSDIQVARRWIKVAE